jgi:DNA invertase Pin-like site-specific DNA recombinase
MSTHANAPLTPEGRRRLWGVGKNAVTSRNRAAVARAKGRLRGKQPELSAKQQTELRRMHTTGDYSIAELFNIGRATVYRTLRRQATSES